MSVQGTLSSQAVAANIKFEETSLAKGRKILQTGGFFHMLMPALLSGISGLVTQLIKNAGSHANGFN